MVDVQQLLTAISPDSPSGDDLEYDAAFLELERTAQGQPERQMGDSVLPAEPPDWRQVREQSAALFARSKDLRIANYYLQSSIVLDGVAGLAQALQLIQALLQQFWDSLHPVLDADDDNDPTFRINALAGISAEPVVRLLWDMPLIRSRAFGTVTLRAALNASGLQRFTSESMSLEQVGGAFRDSDAEQVEACRAAITAAQAALQGIEREVNERVGSDRGAELGAIKQLLRHAVHIVNEHAPAAGGEQASSEQPAPAEPGEVAAVNASAPRPSGEINHRDDVLKALDRILAYYARHEPSSPVPVLLNRAKTLVNADFATIVRNLIPDGFSQFERFRGPEGE